MSASPAEQFADLSEAEQDQFFDGLTDSQLRALPFLWRDWQARPEQLAPVGDWLLWVIRAGRGFGKTRAGAEAVREAVEAGVAHRIALVSDTAADTRDVMIEGRSGLLSIGPPESRPRYESSKRRLTWPNGAVAIAYAAEAPEMLRGPEHDFAWADELAKWQNLRKPDAQGGTAWDNLQMGLRIGDRPRCIVTTTPRAVAEVRRLLRDPRAVITTGSTYDNSRNLAPSFIEEIRRKYEGTRLGRQELHAELLDDVEGALWTHSMIDNLRVDTVPCELRRIAVAIDPAATSGEGADENGIIGGGLGVDGHVYIMADASLRGTPGTWARAALNLMRKLGADSIVAEVNNGGEMVEHTLRSTALPTERFRYRPVHASRGKMTRAEPIAAMYEQKRAHHVGTFPELEDQMCSWCLGDPNSPDRMDALVWLVTDLCPNQAPAGRMADVRQMQDALPKSLVDRETLRAFS